ncbi:hypothetical protein D3C80_2182650 [compost metagenome]
MAGNERFTYADRGEEERLGLGYLVALQLLRSVLKDGSRDSPVVEPVLRELLR